MRNVSSAFKQALANDNRAYLEYADFVLTDETELHITNANLWQGGFSFEDSVSSGSVFEVGSAIINKATLVLNNIYEDYDGVDFFGATVTLSIGLTIGENIETIQLGKYTVVNNPTYNGSLITIEMYDNMYKFDEPYSHSNLTYPASLKTIINNACTWCGITLITQNFPNNDFVVAERPDDENLTFREVLAYAAQIAGCYARCDSNGYLTLKWFDQDALETARTTDNVSGVQYIDSIYNKQFSVDDVVITGVRVSIQVERETEDQQTGYTTTTYETVEYLEGSEGYVISIENNPLIAEDQVEDVAEYLGTRINGFAFKTADVSHSSDPSIEAGDVAICIDLKGNRYPILVSSTTFKGSEAQSTQSIAEEPVINAASRISVETKNYVALRKLLAVEKTERERVEEDLAERIDNAQGLFETQVQQTGGGVITYLHNKPLLAESDIQIKVSTVGVTVTANGTAPTPTWYGLTVDGQLIANILTTSGVNADWINTGQLVITKDGVEVFFADVDTGAVRISGESIHISPGDPIDSAMGYTLETPFTYSNNGQTANFSAVLYHRNIDVTSQFPASWFTWTLRTENGETSLGEGKTKAVAKSDCSFGATVTCKFTTYEQESELTDVDDAQIEDVDDTPISTFTHVEGSRNIADTPVKLQSSILLTDYIVSVSAAEIYRTTHNEYGQFIYDNFVAPTMNGKVTKSGDTMTGNLAIQKASPQTVYYSTDIDLAVGQTIPSAATTVGGFQVNDKQNWNSGWFRIYKNENDLAFAQMALRRSVSGSTVMNSLTIGVNPDGTRYVSMSESAVWRTALGAVYKGGDIMTGVLTVQRDSDPYFAAKNPNIDAQIGKTIPASNTTIGRFIILDNTGTSCASVTSYKNQNDLVYTTILARRKNASDTMISNELSLGVNASGVRTVSVSDASVWRTALGVNYDSAWGTNKVARYKKQGNVVTVTWSGTNTDVAIPASTSTWTTVATLPDGYRPSLSIYTVAWLSSSITCALRISSSGVIDVCSGSAANSGVSIRFSIAFVI